MQQAKQPFCTRLQLLAWLALNAGKHTGNQPTRLAHLDDGNDRAILVQGDEGPAQVVRLGHQGTPSVGYSDDGAISSPPAPYHLSAGGRRIRTAGPTSESARPRHRPDVSDRQHPSCISHSISISVASGTIGSNPLSSSEESGANCASAVSEFAILHRRHRAFIDKFGELGIDPTRQRGELLRNVGDGRGQAASGCWRTASMPSMNFTP